MLIATKLKHLQEVTKLNHQIITYVEVFMNLSGEEVKAQEEIAKICMPKDLEESLEIAETIKVLQLVVSEETDIHIDEENTASNIK